MEDGKVVRKILEAAQDETTPLPVKISSSALPTGASTADLQTTGNASLTSINGKLPTLVGGKIPVEATVTASATVAPVVTTSVNIDFSSSSEQTIIAAPSAGYRIWIYSLELSALVNVEVAVKDGSTTIRTYRGLSISGPAAPISLTAATAMKMQATTADRITGGISYAVVTV